MRLVPVAKIILLLGITLATSLMPPLLDSIMMRDEVHHNFLGIAFQPEPFSLLFYEYVCRIFCSITSHVRRA